MVTTEMNNMKRFFTKQFDEISSLDHVFIIVLKKCFLEQEPTDQILLDYSNIFKLRKLRNNTIVTPFSGNNLIQILCKNPPKFRNFVSLELRAICFVLSYTKIE